ncbi:hypothetical protein ACFWBR_39720 [Streptomyces sp. NPDC060006]
MRGPVMHRAGDVRDGERELPAPATTSGSGAVRVDAHAEGAVRS